MDTTGEDGREYLEGSEDFLQSCTAQQNVGRLGYICSMQIIVVGNVLIKKMIVNRYRDKLSLDVFYNINEKIMEEMMNVFYDKGSRQ